MECPYIYPRDEDWAIARLVEHNRRVIVVGPRGSGVTTLLKRLQSIARVPNDKVVEAHSLDEALSALDMGALVAGINLGLLDIARLPARTRHSGVEVVVLKPLSPAEAYDYIVNVFGVRLKSIELIDEILWRTGGYPGSICGAVIRHGLRGRVVTRRDLRLFGVMPGWLKEAVETVEDELKRLAIHIFLKKFSPELARRLGAGTDDPWLQRGGDGSKLVVWHELLWLEPFLQRLYPSLAVAAYREALKECDDPYLCFIHASSLHSLVGTPETGLELISRGREAIDSVEDPVVRYRLVRTVLETALDVKPSEAPYWLAKLVEVHGLIELTPGDATWILGVSGKLVGLGVMGKEQYVSFLEELGKKLVQWGHSDSLEPVLSELEKLVWEDEQVAPRAETAYNLLQAWRYALQGRWRTALNILREVSRGREGLGDEAYLEALAHIALGDTAGAKHVLEKIGNRQYRLLVEALIGLMESKSLAEAEQKLGKTMPGNVFAQTILALISAVKGQQPPLNTTPYWLAHIASALHLIVHGRVGEAYRIIQPVENTIPQLAVVALDLAVAVLAQKTTPQTLVEALDQLKEELARIELRGAAETVKELEEALRSNDMEAAKLSIIKLIVYSAYL